MMSHPASAWTSACWHSASIVSSLATWPSRTMPSWPSALYGSRATSQMTPKSEWAALTARAARQTRLSGFDASSQSEVFNAAGTAGKMATAGMPRDLASATASTRRSMV